MSRPIAVPRWAIYGLVFGLYLTARGYQSLDGDQAYRLPLLLHRQDPSLYADDPFVRAFDAFNPHRGYLALLDLASRPLGLEFGLFALFAATFALTCVGISRLARWLWPALGPNVGLVAVGLVLMARAGNVGTNHLFEPMLLDRLIGFGLGWVALALAIEGEIWRPSLLIGLAAVVHPTVGLQLGGLIGTGWIAWSIAGRWTGQSWRSTGVGLLVLGLALLPGVLPNLVQGRRLFDGLTPEEFRRIGVELQMAQHMVPSLWRRPQWLAWGGYVVLCGISLIGPASASVRDGVAAASSNDVATDESAPIRFALVFAVLLAGLALSYIAVETIGDLRVTVFQPFRMATIARGLALIALAGRCLSLWRRGDLIGRGRVLVLAAGLTGDWAFVVAVAFDVVASLGEVLRRGFELGSWTSPPLDLGFRPGPRQCAERTRACKERAAPFGNVRLTARKSRLKPSNPTVDSPPTRVGWGSERLSPVLMSLLLVLACGFVFLVRHDTERGHRPLAVAVCAGVAVRFLAPRLERGWTRRRLAFSVAACWLVPVAAFLAPIVAGPESVLASALAARCRFGMTPTDDVERLALWAKAHTSPDARFITPPGPKTFRLWSERSVAFNRAASPYHAAGLKDWSDRFRAHVGFAGSTDEFVRAYLADRHGLESRYSGLSPQSLAVLAVGQGAEYILAPRPEPGGDDPGPLRVLRVEGRYAIYRVDSDLIARGTSGASIQR